MVVFVEAAIMDDPLLTKNPAFTPNIKEKLMTFTEGKDDLTDKVDFISKLLNYWIKSYSVYLQIENLHEFNTVLRFRIFNYIGFLRSRQVLFGQKNKNYNFQNFLLNIPEELFEISFKKSETPSKKLIQEKN